MTMFVFYRTSTRGGRLDMLENVMACILGPSKSTLRPEK